MKNKLIYLNCTAIAPHIGCMAVTDYHLQVFCEGGFEVSDIVYCNFPWASLWKNDKDSSIASCLDSELGRRLAAADIVVLNGEGTLHHGPGVGLLIAAATARKLGKPVHLINTSIFAVEGFDDVLDDLTDLNVRESESSEHLKRKGISHRLVLDSFLGANFLQEADRDFCGRTVVMDWHPNRDKDVGRLTLEYLESLPEDERYFLPLNHYSHVDTWRHTVANLATADLVISGRYHGAYLAGLAGKAFVALPSNTRKIQGLFEASGLPLPICENYSDLEKSIKYARQNPTVFLEFQEFLKKQIPLTTLDPLLEVCSKESLASDISEVSKVKQKIEKKIEEARLLGQYNSLLSSNRKRVETTHFKQLQNMGLLVLRKVRSKMGF